MAFANTLSHLPLQLCLGLTVWGRGPECVFPSNMLAKPVCVCVRVCACRHLPPLSLFLPCMLSLSLSLNLCLSLTLSLNLCLSDSLTLSHSLTHSQPPSLRVRQSRRHCTVFLVLLWHRATDVAWRLRRRTLDLCTQVCGNVSEAAAASRLLGSLYSLRGRRQSSGPVAVAVVSLWHRTVQKQGNDDNINQVTNAVL